MSSGSYTVIYRLHSPPQIKLPHTTRSQAECSLTKTETCVCFPLKGLHLLTYLGHTSQEAVRNDRHMRHTHTQCPTPWVVIPQLLAFSIVEHINNDNNVIYAKKNKKKKHQMRSQRML